uniref:Uncharacterized protein n=1 Tax=Trypanosoma vivax (strain Y486) TaxID=1055687 RepID=G0TVL4_TRYVY|nr:conserved hypothetical protein, fragment [Trypanosoma vivax Y486]
MKRRTATVAAEGAHSSQRSKRESLKVSANAASIHEEPIIQRLHQLLQVSRINLKRSVDVARMAVAAVFVHQNAPVVATFVILFISSFVRPYPQTIVCTIVVVVLYAVCMTMQVFLLWLCVTEKRRCAVAVMEDVLARWQQHIDVKRESDRPQLCAPIGPRSPGPHSRPFRVATTVDVSTGQLMYSLKCLVMKDAQRLDRKTLKVRRYTEPQCLCKLVDVMQMIFESNAIMLRPLRENSLPPRRITTRGRASKDPSLTTRDEDITTDESDHEHSPRADANGAHTSSVPQQMAFLVQRVFMLLWVIGLVVSITAGFLFRVHVAMPITEDFFISSAVAMLGLVPVNAIFLNSVLVLYANVTLDCLFRHLVSKPAYALDDRIPCYSFWTIITRLRHVLRPGPGRLALCLTSSLVETLGTATVVALLDTSGVVTDMVPLPARLLMFRPHEAPQSCSATTSSSSSDNDTDECGYTAHRYMNNSGPRSNSITMTASSVTDHKQTRRNTKRKKYQERRFIELQLTPSLQEDLAVQFSDEKELKRCETNVNSIALCLLVHSVTPEPPTRETWQEPLRFCDQTPHWARGIHWISRACGMSDSVAGEFRLLARILHIDTKASASRQRNYPEQVCTLLVMGADNAIHAFTIGTACMVVRSCSHYFNGVSIEELDSTKSAELVGVGQTVWEDGMGFETIAAAHALLPEEFSLSANTIKPTDSSYKEFFYYNGTQVTARNYHSQYNFASRQSGHQQGGPKDAGGDDACCQSSTVGDKGVQAAGLAAGSGENAVGVFGDGQACYGTNKDRRKASPLDENGHLPSSLDSLEGLLEYFIGNCHTFLGLVGMHDSIRPNVQNSMTILDEAGIRCMYFCPEGERRTKSLGSRLGLETDWNCCISLMEGADDLDAYSIRAQLPVGIESIRRHIVHVDSIPLQVKMFSHAHHASTRAMLSILQDNHEVVVAIGSLFNHGNVRSFIQCGSVHWYAAEKERYLHSGSHGAEALDINMEDFGSGDAPLYRHVADLIGCACTLSAPATTSILPIVTTLIRQARLRLSGIGNCVRFTIHANFLISLVNVIAVVMGAPLLISPVATVFELNVIVPILALSCTYTAYTEKEPMKTIYSRHNYFVRLKIFQHEALVWSMRYIPSLIGLLVLGLTCGMRTCHAKCLFDLVFFETDKCMTATRGYISLTLNYWMMIHSWTHMSRHKPFSPALSFKTRYGKRYMYLFKSFRWVAASVLATTLSVAYVLIDAGYNGVIADAFFPSHLHFFTALLFPVFLLLLDVPIKSWRLRRYTFMQKFRRLSFGTRLGMHSPRGDYEPEIASLNVTNGSGINSGSNPCDGDGETGIPSTPLSREPVLRKRLHDTFYRFTTTQSGRLELNCVCCDHMGGNYATYHVNPNDL